jgi:tetratricopeptide (TPR) repeat protein
MKSLKETPLAKADATRIEQQLNLLVDDFLVERAHEGVTTHPVIRRYFRAGHKITDSRREVADFLQARPGDWEVQSIEDVRDLVEAVELFCEEENFAVAHMLHLSRLNSGEYSRDIFTSLPAVSEGLACESAFVKDENRRQKVKLMLGSDVVAFHCSGLGLYHSYLGNLDQALGWYQRWLDMHLESQHTRNIAFALDEISDVYVDRGDIKQALESLYRGLNYVGGIDDFFLKHSIFARKAYSEFLLGNVEQACHDFELARSYKIKCRKIPHLGSIWGCIQAEFFIRIGARNLFEELSAYNIKVCKEFQWNDKLAIFCVLEGWQKINEGNIRHAETVLAEAERILRPSGIVESVLRLDSVWALLAEAKGEYQKGLQRVNDSLLTCADKGFRLWQADHFVLRGRLRLLQFQKEHQKDKDLLEKAGDDGHEALRIAEDTGYIWAKVDALKLLGSYHQARARLSGFNAEDEKEAAQRHAKEAASLKTGLFLTEKQMQKLKAQARREFEKQIAGWDTD